MLSHLLEEELPTEVNWIVQATWEPHGGCCESLTLERAQSVFCMPIPLWVFNMRMISHGAFE